MQHRQPDPLHVRLERVCARDDLDISQVEKSSDEGDNLCAGEMATYNASAR
jgi:hypothetical protein